MKYPVPHRQDNTNIWLLADNVLDRKSNFAELDHGFFGHDIEVKRRTSSPLCQGQHSEGLAEQYFGRLIQCL